MEPAPKTGPDEIVTLVVKHRIKPGLEADYEAWLRRIVRIAGERPGHLGVDVVRGKQDGLALFTCVLRYRSTDDLERWLDSPQRKALIDEAAPMLADGDQTEIGAANEFWFTPLADSAAKPPRWKQAVVTLCVILPLTLLVPIVWGPVLRLHPLLSNYVVSTFLVTVTIVVLVVYLLMPAATRLFAPWLEASVKETL
ncbi:antibiotic biosynthesis monooxygenase [Pseudomonas lurida]|jgi:antibiotic biosynthesis monooxygenase (ABM) superfamily enzyme|uniref:antibiotic biosynthesis monooxygenase n=1 Tax=Pseudomonas TaxID=286 RepID=UPI0015E36857|nr:MULTISPECIES: antibiotic biosynthesis monooxygenase [Pseudomonas]MBA1292562.1 antibiotic biosynthesis monooxygenase [Pseudomonas lurida]MCP1511475.1 antibiotic biosynthesis monooxygenase (ABM) superfamily enzyme [Pseudomonas rhodesiae]MDF9770299.1 antibiotic biosynthesis monooxygenase (ABM) superfamily enzyme [Pseudomonas rhodesiae]WLH38843.1 antibiotic biosynthesis monooxygenase [Pseudomonas sp. FP2254]